MKRKALTFITLFILLFALVLFILNTRGIGMQQIKLAWIMSGHELVLDNNKLQYRLYNPKVSGNKKIPLVLILQSAYGRGSDNIRHLSNTVSKFTSSDFQSIESSYILAPQCPNGLEWNNNRISRAPFINYDMDSHTQSWRQTMIISIIDELIKSKNVDPHRIYITGESMGASGSWEFLYRYPNKFAAAIILNGRNDPAKASTISRTPMRIFHGRDDKIAPVQNSIDMISAINNFKSDAHLQILETGHSLSNIVYNEPLYHWLLSNQTN